MATETEQLVVALEARVRDFERSFQRAGQVADNKFSAIERRARQSADRMEGLMNSTALSVNRALGAIGAGISFDQIRRFADAWTEAGNKIKAAAAASGVQARSLNELKVGANEARVSLQDYSDLYARLIRSGAGVAKNEEEIARATNITAKAFKAGGASASEQASGILQLGQALGSGVLQGDELRSLRENAPILAKAIADAFKVPLSALKSLGEQGKLTSKDVFAAILAAGPQVEQQFNATTATIGDSFTRLSNELTAYVGSIASAHGISAAFRAVVEGLANNIPAVTNAAAAAAAVLLGAFIPALTRAAAASAIMVATNPFLLLATAAGAAAFAVTSFGDQIKPIAGDLANLQDYAAVAWDTIKQGASSAADMITTAFKTTIDYLSNALAGVGVSWQDVAKVAKGVANIIVNSFVLVYDVLVTTFTKLPAAIAETTIAAVNGMIALVERALNGVIELVNATVNAINIVGGKVGLELGKVGAVALGRIESAYAGAGEKAANAYIEAFRDVTKDRVGQALSGINSQADAALESLRKRANERATKRKANEAATSAASTAGKSAAIPPAKTMPVEMTKEYVEIQKRIALLQAEIAIRRSIPNSIEQAEAALERQKIAQELVNQAIKEGVVMTDDVKTKIGALADAYSNAAQEAKALAQSQQEAAAKAKDLEETSKGVFKGFISDLIHGKSASEALASALGKLGEKFLDMGLDQLWSQTFGKSNPLFSNLANALSPTTPNVVKAPGSPLQGVNFSLPGIQAPTAVVNAGAVTVNGPVAGAGVGQPQPSGPSVPSTPSPSTPTGASENLGAAAGKSAVERANVAGLPDPFAKSLTAPGVSRGVADLPISQFGAIDQAKATSVLSASNFSKQISLSPQEIVDLKKTLMTEWVTGQGDAQGQGIIDTILNRKVSGKWGGSITDVVNAPKQFSDINGRPAWQRGRNSVDDLSVTDPRYDRASKLVDDYLAKRSAGAPSSVGGHLNYANPTESDAANMPWINGLDGPRFGSGRSSHVHGTAFGMKPVDPNYGIKLPGQTDAPGLDVAAQAQEQALQAQLEAQRRLQEQMQQATQATQGLTQPLQGIGAAATDIVPNLGGMTSGLTGLIAPLSQAVPGLGQFGGAIQGVVQQLTSGMGGGGAGIFSGLGSLFGGFAEGGRVSGPGTATSDSIPAMLSNGEFVVNAKATKKHGALLSAINEGKAPAFATGGIVGRNSFASNNTYSPNLTVNVSGGPQGNRFAQQIAGEVGKTLDSSRPDRFRRSEGQAMAATGAQLQRMSARNN